MVPILWVLLGRPFPTDDIKTFLCISLNYFIILNFNIRFSDEAFLNNKIQTHKLSEITRIVAKRFRRPFREAIRIK